MNDRLEIASRLMAGWCASTRESQGDEIAAVNIADRLIAEEARTRPPAADDAPIDPRVGKAVCINDRLHFVPVEVAAELDRLRTPAPDDLRAVMLERDAWKLKATEAMTADRRTPLGSCDADTLRLGDKIYVVPKEVADLRAVAEELYTALLDSLVGVVGVRPSSTLDRIGKALTRAHAIGLGGGK